MSKHETPMIRKYWEKIGGTLVEEYPAVRGSDTRGKRYIDAIILPNQETRIAHWSEIAIKGEDIIVVQAKAHRLGMYLMGQTLFSADLMRRFEPASITSIALCRQDDSILRPLLERFDGMQVVVMEPGDDE